MAADDIRTVPFRRLAAVALSALMLCATAAAASGDPQYRPAPADQSWAESILLGANDFGGSWVSLGSGGAMTSTGPQAATCSAPDESDLVVTGGSYSANFLRYDGASVTTGAVVWQTAEQAQADWDRNLQPAIMGCLAAELQSASTKRVKVLVTGRRQIAWPPLAQRVVAYRLSLLLKATTKSGNKTRKVSIRATSDFVALGSGRATAMLWTVSFNSQPLSDSNKQQYALLMLRRMAADPLAAR
jgi:hypothetical protein